MSFNCWNSRKLAPPSNLPDSPGFFAPPKTKIFPLKGPEVLGCLKTCEIADLALGSTFTNQRSKKRHIIAVTKSA